MLRELALSTYAQERPRALGTVGVLVRVENIALNENTLRVPAKGAQVFEEQVCIVRRTVRNRQSLVSAI